MVENYRYYISIDFIHVCTRVRLYFNSLIKIETFKEEDLLLPSEAKIRFAGIIYAQCKRPL